CARWACSCPQEGATIPIGRPIDNVAVYVLDPRMEPTPIGVTGEMFVGGVGVGKGYLGRDQLTAARFVVDPFGEGRLYRTGDLGRWRPDGVLEFLGRADTQVKIRGFRVEPEQVERVLMRHPAVVDCVVVTRDDGYGTA